MRLHWTSEAVPPKIRIYQDEPCMSHTFGLARWYIASQTTWNSELAPVGAVQ